ncbi:hypothetical protein E9531_06510 [Lampropedia puyangensis]|uniref:Outer membrane protein assembly factor BamE n=1 Tax=Lampropedia puyangensis TaxID=1330072 RepID=A0A4S8F772_9BURK|nr:hypothetical protein [Lampropedia puyangensis]THU02751.1 hypothetical protein E9531_06510 [Lampropedia puyangensis]
MRVRLFVCLTLLCTIVAGCASSDGGAPHPASPTLFGQRVVQGLNQDQLRAQRGEPFAIYTNDQGSIWFYNTAIRDMQRDRVVFDTQKQLITSGPAWTRAAFSLVQAQTWTTAQLLQHFGPPIRQEMPRAGLLQSLGDDAPASNVQAEADTDSRNWIYGSREFNRYFIVTITVDAKGVVSNIEISADPNNTTQ